MKGKGMDDFQGKRVLVMGGSAGIGLATAVLASERGAQVTIVSRSPDRLAQARRAHPAIAQGHSVDLTDALAVQEFFTANGDWDHVVVSGSQTHSDTVRGMALDDARAAMQSKFWGAYHVARACRIRAPGSLTLVSGVFSVRPSRHAVLQGAINAALEGLMRGLALELAPVRVNAVSPSVTDTPLWDRLDGDARQSKFESYAARVPLGRVARPAEIALAILSLAGNPYITGSTLLVDGGDALA
jgi:NAD(P)-dependent dehydrogenase (short-subunit alcohol dehydrogenase family)